MFQQIGGVKIGRDILRCWNIGWPFARLFIHNDSLGIRVFLFGVTKEYAFARDEIVSLRIQKATFSRVLVIEHRNAKLPSFIAFEAFPTRTMQTLLDDLQRCGYSIMLDQ